jgi:hypothetical protein
MDLLNVESHRPGTMARKPRVEYAGAFYHVICRGNQRQVIFRSDADPLSPEYYSRRAQNSLLQSEPAYVANHFVYRFSDRGMD